MGFKENLRQFREQAGLTQSEVANRAGIPFRSYQNWETGSREPRLQALPSLADALGVTVNDLLKPSAEEPGKGAGRPRKGGRPPKATPSTPTASDLEAKAKKPKRAQPKRGK
jgi:transcriptional regulator with XRE-family HTH domain